jgi:hypothetical protein
MEKRAETLSPQRRPVYLPSVDDQLKAGLDASLFERLRAEAERRNGGLAQVVRALSPKRPK